MEKVEWNVEGMTCSNCALSVTKLLQKEGMEEVKVNPINGAVSFNNPGKEKSALISGINSLGYNVAGELSSKKEKNKFLNTNKKRFLFCLPFTLVLMLHMLHSVVDIHWLMNPWVQLGLCIPVFIVGMDYFGRSAINSLKSGVPNMNVLIALGAIASFIYSLTGAILGLGDDYLFFETTASIITIVFIGNYMEEKSIQSTQKAIKSLAKSQKVMANMIAFDDEHKEQIFPVENTVLKTGDLLLIKSGEQVPIDCKILWGDVMVNEAIITGESMPVSKTKKDILIGGSLIDDGIVRVQVTATGKDTVLSGILKMVQDAQGEKPPAQKMADKISAIFVPVVIGISIVTFLVNYYGFNVSAGSSLMRTIAVLVISCPCAMGLATPAAIAVGLGRAAKTGILFRNASSLESFKNITQVVFDKTGTITTGKFVINKFHSTIEETEFKKIIYSLEKFSNHPIGKSVAALWKTNDIIKWKKINEIKGIGIKAEDREGNIYIAGSQKISEEINDAIPHNIYLSKNDELLGWVDIMDEVRPESASIISWFKSKNIKTILLTGDLKIKAEEIASQLKFDEFFYEQSPSQKLD
ncbi:MAG: cation-translocating P-type ATPase, partial [Ferruginibacter sp.]